jgi:hypothetical protein
MKPSLLIALLVVTACLPKPAAGESNAAKQYYVRISVLEGDPKGSVKQHTQHVLADPCLVVAENKEAQFHTGGEIKVGAAPVPSGTSVKVVVRQAADGKVRVMGMIELSTIRNDDDEVAVRESLAVHFNKVTASGKKILLPISKEAKLQRWIVLSVETMDKPLAAKIVQ